MNTTTVTKVKREWWFALFVGLEGLFLSQLTILVPHVHYELWMGLCAGVACMVVFWLLGDKASAWFARIMTWAVAAEGVLVALGLVISIVTYIAGYAPVVEYVDGMISELAASFREFWS